MRFLSCVMAFAAIGSAWAQDESGKLLEEAITKTLEAGGFQAKGQAALDADESLRSELEYGAKEFDGAFDATVKGSLTVLSGKSGSTSVEIYKNGEKQVIRQTHKKKEGVYAERFAGDVTSLLNLKALAKGKYEKPGEDKVGERICTLLTGTLPEDVIPAEDEDGEMAWDKIKKIEAKVWIDKESGQIVKTRFRVTRTFNDYVMGEEEEEEDEEEDEQTGLEEWTNEYAFELTGKPGDLEIPKDVQKLLDE